MKNVVFRVAFAEKSRHLRLMRNDAFLAANAAFYQALRDADLGALAALLATQDVSCVHPNSYVLFGRDAVLASWARILENGPLTVTEDAAVCVPLGDAAAMVVCSEHIEPHVLAATNVFVVENGRVRLAHHHVGPTPGGGPSAGQFVH